MSHLSPCLTPFCIGILSLTLCTFIVAVPAFDNASRSDHEPSSANHNAAFPSDGIDIITVRRCGLRAWAERTWTETGRLFVYILASDS